MPVPPKIIVEDTWLIADEITRTAENVPNVSVVAIEVVRRQGPPNARTQAQNAYSLLSIVPTINLFT
ncbi:MAG: hypothetical protein ACI4W0_04935 [Bacilli bacterium]